MIHQVDLCPVCQREVEEHKFRPFCSAECSNVDLDRVRDELIAGLEHLAENLMGGPPSIRKPRTWRWGTKGSFVLEMAGRKRGAWHDKESLVGGGPFHLIQRARSCTMAEAIAWAREWTGGAPNAGHDFKAERAARQAHRDKKAREHEAADADDTAKRIRYAARLWSYTTPIAGTVAERYLVDQRRIPRPVAWPETIRFHEPTLSLIVGATLADGTLQAVQRVYLTRTATKIDAAEVTARDLPGVKASNGTLTTGAIVRLPGDSSGPLLLAEGPETGLSVWAATGYETWIALGGMGRVPLPADRRLVACRDDDPKHSPADKKMGRTVEAWRAAGFRIAVASPWPFRAYDKTDFNDALKLDGVAGVKRRIEAALNPGGGAPARLPIKRVRERLRSAVGEFFDATRDYHEAISAPPPLAEPDTGDAPSWGDILDAPASASAPAAVLPVHAIKTDVGSGKTRATLAEARRLLVEMRAAGDMRAAAFAVPTHVLGDEQAAIFEVEARGTGLTVAVWRGMSATDPDSPSDPMCRNLEAVQDARDAMQDTYKTCCKRKLDDGTTAICPFFSVCGYERQRQTEVDLWIVAHEMIFGEKPTAIGKLAFLVVDEAVWQDGLDGVHGRPTALSLDSIAHLPMPTGDVSVGQRLDNDRLTYLRNRLLDTLRPSADGPVTAEAVEASDLSLDNTREAYRLEWARFVDCGLHPGMTKAQRREAVGRAAVNATIPRLSSVWEAMTALLEDGGPSRSGWASLAVQPSDDGPVRVLHLKGRRKVRKGWQVPTLLIDATMNIDLVRPYWPDVELTAELLADAPHQTVRQVVDRAYSKSGIEPLTTDQPGYTPEEAKRRNRGLRNVHAVINREARRYGGADVLVVAQKAVREALPTHGPMAACIDLAHHNAVAGQDKWRDVRALIVVGRTQPAPASVERLAEALTGRAVEHVEGWYARGDGVRHTADAGAVAIEADRHPEPIAEAIRWQVCEGELLQIIGRGRGVNRTEADPLDVLVLTDAPLPLPVAVTLQAADLAPNPYDLMLAAGGVILENPTDASTTYPHLWASRNAANHALKRWRAESTDKTEVGAKPLYISIIRGMAPTSPTLSRVAYQVAGPGKSSSVAWCDPLLTSDAAEWLTGRLGVLAWCHDGREPEPPPTPQPPAARAPRPAPAAEPVDPPPVWVDAAPPPDDPADPGWQDAPEWMLHAVDPEIPGSSADNPAPMELDMYDPPAAEAFACPEQALLDPGLFYPRVPRSAALVEPVSMVLRLRPGAISRAAARGGPRAPVEVLPVAFAALAGSS